jgi:hypothetical protein
MVISALTGPRLTGPCLAGPCLAGPCLAGPRLAGPRLADLFDTALLAAMVQQGYVRVQRHPSAPLVIHN